MTFDEPVRVSSILFHYITLISQPTSFPKNFRKLTGGEIDDDTNYNGTMKIVVHLTQPDIRHFKLSETDLANDETDTFISVIKGMILDMADNPLVAIPYNESLQVKDIILDTTPATLIDFQLDMNEGLLHLTFNDIINSSTLYAPAITIQSSKYIMTDYVTLTKSSTTNSDHGYYITVNISTEDLNRIKLNDNLATQLANTYVSMRAEAFMDNFEVDVIAVTSHDALPASKFINDTTSPELLYFSLDMDSGTISLTFDETVRANTIVEEEITLLGSSNISNISYVTLIDGIASTQDSTVVDISIVKDDLNEIKFLTDLGTSTNNTFIAFNSELIMDMNDNPVSAISEYDAQQAKNFSEDQTSPSLELFSINLTDNTLTLIFDETVNATSLMTTELTIQGDVSLEQNAYRLLQSSSGSSDDSTIIIVYLGLSDLNEIKRLTNVATSKNDTYLSATSLTIEDMNGNHLVSVPFNNAIRASNYYGDTIRPYLEGFSLNLSSEILTLSFSETVQASTHYVQLYTLLSSESIEDTKYDLTGALATSEDYHILEVELTTADLNVIKRLTDLATNDNNTYILVESGAIKDMFGNPLLPLEKTIQVTTFTEDFVQPVLTHFDLDMNVGELTLFFSETVNTSTFKVDQILLQDNQYLPNATNTFWLTNDSYINSTNYHIVTVYIGDNNLNEIKRLHTLALDNSTTYLSITSNLVTDMNNNSIIEIPETGALFVSKYNSDTTPPELEEFDLNINVSLLVLHFSETVDRESLNVTAITLQHNVSSTSDVHVLVLSNNSYSISPNGTTITIHISIYDLNELKRLNEIATSNNNTYLSITSDAILDMAGNPVVPILQSDALHGRIFTPDEIRPELEDFSLDMNIGVLQLTFSETVNALTFNISTITLQSTRNTSESYTLKEGLLPDLSYSNSSDSTILTVYLGIEDMNALKKIYNLVTTENNTFLSITENGVEDMTGLSLVPISFDEALPVTTYIEDSTSPVLLSLSLNLSSEILSLTFDETVNVDSLNVTEITIQSSSNFSVSTFVDLKDLRDLSPENSTIVSFRLAFDDLNDIKLDENLATDTFNTWLRLFPSAITDMAYEPNPIEDTIQRVTLYTNDSVKPNLLSFYVDLDAGYLVLNFDEPVDVSTLNYTSFTLYSTKATSDMINASLSLNDTFFSANGSDLASGSGNNEAPLTYFTLTDGFTNSSNGLQITLVFTLDDLNAIKKDEYLYTNRHSSYLSITQYAIEDMTTNQINSINPSNAIRAFQYVNDETSPVLTGYDLDMDTGLLILYFPETIDVSSIMFDGIVLQRSSNVNISTGQYMLTSGRLNMTEDGIAAYIQITHDDLNEIKQRRIALTNSTTWLTIEKSTLLDMSEQPLLPLVNGYSAQQVAEYTSDITSPTLQFFVLNLDANTLFMSFSETVDGYNLNVSTITLQDTSNGSYLYNHYSLSSGSSYVTSAYGPNVTITIGLDDMNIIKELIELAIDKNSTFISFTQELVADVFGNDIIDIKSTSATQVSELIDDKTSPVLEAFELNMDTKILQLYFSETVNGSSLNITAFTLWESKTFNLTPSEYYNTERYTLQTSNTSTTYDSVIIIDISDDDFNRIKQLLSLATNINNTYLSLTSYGVLDTSNNDVTSISSDSALQARNYTKDATNPRLTGFDLDMNELILTLTFSETVNVSSIDYTAVTILNSNDDDIPVEHTLLKGNSSSVNGPIIVVEISKDDEDIIKRLSALATTRNNTYISISSSLILDMDDLPVVNITFDMPLPVTNFTEDTTQPKLISFNLNLTSDILTLIFSETVNVSTLDISEILLQNDMTMDNYTVYHYLTDSSFVDYNDPVVIVELSFYDRNEIRRLYMLATEKNNTYLSLSAGAIQDMVSLPLVPTLNITAEQVTIYTADNKSPSLVSFSLDMTEEIMVLNFTETINISTFDAAQLTVVGIDNSSSYKLTGGVVNNTDHTHSLTLLLLDPDLNAIKFDTDLATSVVNTHLIFTSALVSDMNSNMVIPVTIPRMAIDFRNDTIDPVLISFDFDANEGTLTLLFSETVNAGSLNATQITLLPYTNASINETFTFSSETVTYSIDGTALILNISLNDLNEIKRLDQLAIDNTTTFLALTSSAVADMNENFIEPILVSNPQTVTLYTVDKTLPDMVSFSINFTAETLTLSFSETVNASSVDVTAITIQATADNDTISVTLTDGEILTSNDPVVIIKFTQDDLNLIKSKTNLATNTNNTFISATSNLVLDMAGNVFNTISNTSALNATDVFEDTIPPELVNFDLDINEGLITFYFSESVNSYSLRAQFLTLQSTQQSDVIRYTLSNNTAQPIIIQDSSVRLIFTLSDYDQFNIQELVMLATNANNTFLSFTSDFITDQFNNSITPKNTSNALPVKNYTRDITCPELSASSFDLNEGVLVLTFSKPINTSTFDETQLTIYSSISFMSDSHTLTSVEYTRDDLYTRFMPLQLSDYDLNIIKSITDLAYSEDTTYIYLTTASIKDTAGNFYCNNTVPHETLEFTEDITPPYLVNFTVDLDLALITLTFSESVEYKLLDPQQITLLSSPNSSIEYTLKNGNLSVNSTSPHIVSLSLTSSDTNEIKHLTKLASSLDNTYISITNLTVQDYNGNDIEEISSEEAQPASNYLPDQTPPVVLEFDLDMNRGIITLSFTEVINITSLNVQALTIQNQMEIVPTLSHAIKDGFASFESLTRVLVQLSIADVNAIKKIPELASNVSNSYLSFTSNFVNDNAGLPVVSLSDTNAKQAENYTPDGTKPELLAFSLNLTSEILSLTFNETVDASSILVSGITIQSDINKTLAIGVPLTKGAVSIEDSTVIDIKLIASDLHKIKRELDLATNENNTCILIASSSVIDMSEQLNTINDTSLCTDAFTEDNVRPNLVSFGANVNHSELYLYFDEPINIASVNLSLITLQSVKNVSSDLYETYTLKGGNISSPDLLQFTVTMTNNDLNEIKRLLNLLRGPSSSFLSIPAEFATDLNDNFINPITTDDALGTVMFYDDRNRPSLDNFDLDMNTGLLTLSFSETVDISTFDITGITIQRVTSVIEPEDQYTLTDSGIFHNDDNGPVLIYTISNDDLNILKTRGIARQSTVTYLAMTNTTVRDIIGQSVVALVNGIHVEMVSQYLPDINPPLLTSFRLDMNNGLLTLSFNESVYRPSLNVNQLTLTATTNDTSDELSFTLTTKSQSTSLNIPEIVVKIDNDDLNELKKRPNLVISENTTYIYMSDEAIRDMFNNPNVEITPVQATKVSLHTQDITQPELNGFCLDMDTGVLTLSFTETVNTSSLNTAGITLHNDNTFPTQSYSLSGTYVKVNGFAPIVEIELTNDDLNQIKFREMLATTSNDTYLEIASVAINDMNNNLVLSSSILPIDGSCYKPDITPPLLESFVIDMDLGHLILNFSETVRYESVLFDYLAVRANETLPSIPANINRQHQLTNGTVIPPSGPSLTIELTETDLNEIKRKDVCTIDLREQDCYLAYRTGGLTDMAGNPIQGCREL